MNNLDRLTALVEKQKREKAKIEGKLESLYEELADMGYNSIEDAKKDSVKMKKEIGRISRIFNSKLEKFNKEYAEELSKND